MPLPLASASIQRIRSSLIASWWECRKTSRIRVLGAMVCTETKMAILLSGRCHHVHVSFAVFFYLERICSSQQPLLLHVPGLIAQECYNLIYAWDSTYMALVIIRFVHLSNSSQNTRILLVFVGCLYINKAHSMSKFSLHHTLCNYSGSEYCNHFKCFSITAVTVKYKTIIFLYQKLVI